jgi:2-methylcitrate dehydratase PrpD
MLAGRLGRFVAESQWNDLAPALRHEGRRSLLNFLGCAVGVARTPPIDMAVRALLPVSGANRVTLFGRGERLDVLNASFVNAIAGNLLDYDDTHLRTVIHPAAPVVPVAIALSEQRGLAGAAALHALLLGIEVECRIGNAVSPGHYARGWHITSTCGVFGAAAATAKLLALDGARTAHALGIAASQSAGLVENLPFAAKNVGVGNAARNGILAALMAEQGYTAAPGAIEGALGWARAMGDEPDVATALDGLGNTWEAAKNTYKPYPCGIVMHAVIDACLELRQVHSLTAADIASIEISGEQLLLDRGDRLATNDRDARVSITHCAAVALLFGAAGLREFSNDTVQSTSVAAMRARVTSRLDATSPRGAATATLRMVDGRTLTATVAHPIGSLERPLSDRDIESKVRDLAAYGNFAGSIDAAIDAAWRIDTLATIDQLVETLRGD